MYDKNHTITIYKYVLLLHRKFNYSFIKITDMKTNIYLGNGCLNVNVEKNNDTLNLEFEGGTVTTSVLVNIVDFNMISNHTHIRTESDGYDAQGGGTATDILLKTTLKSGEKCIVLCNAQNQIDAYIQFENIAGELKYKTLAEECFYTSEFQGVINGKVVTKNKFIEYVKQLK